MAFPLREWVTRPADAEKAESLAQALDVPVPVATVLVARGMDDPVPARQFLNPRLSDLSDPFELPGMGPAVARTWAAIDAGEPMVVYGDYDVDGVCSTALLVLVLRALGASVQPFLPQRLAEGYGLGPDGLQRCLETHAPSLIITVDCGTASTDAVNAAREAGVDVIVTDHHEPDGEPAPALAVVNPKLGEDERVTMLAGVGVAFKFCHAIVKRGLEEERECVKMIDLRDYLDLVAVATVADIVPLAGENRILVRHGLARLNREARPGFAALKKVGGVRGDVEGYHVGFVLGPRLNAAGRLGDAVAALELLLAEDRETAMQRAEVLDAANRERKQIEETIVVEADSAAAAFKAEAVFGLVVAGEGWHPGTIGIVASRLSGRYYRPVVVIGIDEDGKGRGSCRSIEGLDMLEVLRECDDLLVSYGGHKMAAGLDIEAANIDAFRERLNAACRERLSGRELKPTQAVDAWISLADADRRLLDALASLRPLGMGNPTPTWGVANVRLAAPPRRVGREDQHLKMTVVKGGSQCEAIGFNLGANEPPEGEMDVVFQLRENTYGGATTVEMNVKDVRPSAPKELASGAPTE